MFASHYTFINVYRRFNIYMQQTGYWAIRFIITYTSITFQHELPSV